MISYHKPILKYSVASFIALVLFTTRAILGPGFSSASDITPDNIMSAVNQERTSRNIPALNFNSKLAAAAQYKSSDMITRNYFSHVDPDGNYIWNKIISEGYTPYTILGENLAINFPNTEGLMSAWMDSPTHRENILNADFKDQGVGVAFGNTNAGQFEDAITNTFGAQPIAKATSNKTTAATPPAKTQIAANSALQTPTPAQSKTQNMHNPPPAASNQDIPVNTQIDLNSIKVAADINNGLLDFRVSVNVLGNPENVNATIANDSIALLPDKTANQNYSGDLYFDKYFNWQQHNLIITAQGSSPNQDSASIPLKNIELPASTQNPKSLGNLDSKLKNPDLYNVYKYTVIGFGILFILYFVMDFYYEIKGKIKNFLFKGNSHIVIIFLLVSTLLLVNWWR